MSVKPTITIDLWGTLIKGSPQFAKAKIDLVKKYFPGTYRDSFIERCFVEAKNELNAVIETTGWMPDQEIIFRHFLAKIGVHKRVVGEFAEFIREYQKLAIEIPPEIYSDETIEYLTKMRKIGEIVLSSNTMMIGSESLEVILRKNRLARLIDYYKFSDVQKVSKPHSVMYHSKYHIGDNKITDGLGAERAGSISFRINSNDKTIKDAYHFIAQSENIPGTVL